MNLLIKPGLNESTPIYIDSVLTIKEYGQLREMRYLEYSGVCFWPIIILYPLTSRASMSSLPFLTYETPPSLITFFFLFQENPVFPPKLFHSYEIMHDLKNVD